MGNYGQYDKELSRLFPGLFVILLDQSVSMSEIEEESGQSKASLATRHVNTIIQRMIDFAGTDEYTGKRKKYSYLSVLGYNDQVYPLLAHSLNPVDIPWLDENPLGEVSITREAQLPDGTVMRRITEKMRFWIEPRAEGNTEMAAAFKEAEIVVRNWLNSPPEFISNQLGRQRPRSQCFPPVVINITDAQHNGDGNPPDAANRIRQLQTDNGHVLICNCHFTHKKSQPCIFPKNIKDVHHLANSDLAQPMFEMSSIIPEELRRRAELIMRIPIEPGARCFVYNADPDILVKFLRWTTLGNVQRRR